MASIDFDTPIPADALVNIVTLQGPDLDEVENLTDEELAEHLSRCDYGTENDDASRINGTTELSFAKSLGAFQITHGGVAYWLIRDQLYVALYRQSLELATA